MSAGVYNIEIEQGGDYALAVTYKDSAGLVFDLSSGYTAQLNIKESYLDLDASAIDSLTTASGEITLSSGLGLTNTGTIVVDSSQSEVTVTISSGEHLYEIGDPIRI